MPNRGHRRGRETVLRAAVVVLLLAMAAAAAPAQEAAVIVNRAIGIDQLPLDYLEKILRSERRFLKGRKEIELLVIPPGTRQVEDQEVDEAARARARAIHRVVVEVLFEGRYFEHWQGERKPYKPKEMHAQAAVEIVQRNPKALAIIDAESALPDDVIVLRVDDRLPGEKGYGLRARKR